jgi:ornithine carbamoyltransferase
MLSLLSLRELDRNALTSVVTTALDLKRHPDSYTNALSGKGLLLLMQKTSTRTVLAFTAAIHQLGGYALRMNWQESNFSISPLALEARYVGTTVDAVMARLLRHQDVAELAAHAGIPVINGCDEKYHPSQAVADCLTVYENAGRFDGVRVTYVGVHNNVTNSLLVGCTRLGVQVNLVTPIVNDAASDPDLVSEAEGTGLLRRYDDVRSACANSDFIYTDTWIDMEHFSDPAYQEEKAHRIALMSPFQLNADTVGDSDVKIMHDMPIHPGFEISAELVDDPRSVIFQQAENRLHAAKAILLHLLDGVS